MRIQKHNTTIPLYGNDTCKGENEESLLALSLLGKILNLLRLYVDTGNMRFGSAHCMHEGLAIAIRALSLRLRELMLYISTDDRSGLAVTHVLFAAVGRCVSLSRLAVDLRRFRCMDRTVADVVLAPLVTGCRSLRELQLNIHEGEYGHRVVTCIACLVPRLHTLILRGALPAYPLMNGALSDANKLKRFVFHGEGADRVTRFFGFGSPVSLPPLPSRLGTLHLHLTDAPRLAEDGHIFRLAQVLASADHLVDLELGLRGDGLGSEHWTALCATVGALPRLCRLELDVRRNRITYIADGIQLLSAARDADRMTVRLTHLCLRLDNNTLRDWKDDTVERLGCLPMRFPRLCTYMLSLQGCSLPYGVSQMLTEHRTHPAGGIIRYSF
jgi:hypothetical protein